MVRNDSVTYVAGLTLIAMSMACSQGSSNHDVASPTPASAPGTAVTSDDVQRTPNQSIEQILASKVAGVVVSRTEDGGIALRIRGTSTVNGSGAPLYVIDGVATEAGPGGSIPGINPYDIASIKVLKEAADLSMYGSRGGNGVIVIRTKRPNQ